MRWPTRRATMSVVPPAGNGTTMRSGFDGKLCPNAARLKTAEKTSASNFICPPPGSRIKSSLPTPEIRDRPRFARSLGRVATLHDDELDFTRAAFAEGRGRLVLRRIMASDRLLE